MPKLILHVGTHKTGTTAIQSFLRANAKGLRERGIYFPVFEARWPERVLPDRNGYFLNRAALHRIHQDEGHDDRRLARVCADKLAARLRDEAPETTLLTDERMWYSAALRPAYWEAVRDVAEQIGFDEFQVIVYLRRQDQFAESLWNQFVKATKATYSLEEYLHRDHVRAMCDYYAGVKQLEEVFGRRALTIAVYDRSRLKNGDAVDDFCQRIGLPLGADWERPPANRTNPRLNNSLVELKRVVNRSAEYQQLNNIFGPAFAHAMLADDWTPKTDPFPPGTREAFLEQYAPGNKLLAKEYFAGKRLFKPYKPDGTPQWEFEPEGMLRDAVLVMADMLALQEKRIRNLEAHVAKLEGEARK